MSAGRGYGCAFLAAVLYGVQYTPVKAYPVYDGSKFQWFMSAGIAFSGLVPALILSSGPLYVIPYGILGGALWGTANVLVIPTVKFLGLGVGFAMYHAINMAVGYAIGRFGLLGAPKELARHPALRDGGLWLLLISLAFMIFVEPEIHDPVERGSGDDARMPPRQNSESHLPAVAAGRNRAPNKATRKMDLLLSAAAIKRHDAGPNSRKPGEISRALSAGQLEEQSINAGARLARQGYMNWRRGFAKGALETSSGVVGVRAQVHKDRVLTNIRNSPLLWPLYEQATVRTRYRGMISSVELLVDDRDDAEAAGAAAAAHEASSLLDRATGKARDDAKASARAHKRRRFAVGGACGLVAGLLCGINMLPYVLYLQQQRTRNFPGYEPSFDDTLCFFFSQCFGVFVAATTLLALCAAAARLARIELKSPAVWPPWVAGTLWSAGFLLAAVAVADLGMAQAYTYDAIGPVMISACISFVCGEIVGTTNTIVFLVALALQAAGVIAIATGA
ncbi:hypothetical protein CTAYLR_001019 [Chrysophaeum taylorii]|uniref:Uncharacterized protein n=1 Tax=Chrysophaeum taylorii TaxID=2483200 RepID=A0AAD7UG72_9STRA|nr:hypothetical protein CTAYLR_001019 [Chrysophaeum taylorii]